MLNVHQSRSIVDSSLINQSLRHQQEGKNKFCSESCCVKSCQCICLAFIHLALVGGAVSFILEGRVKPAAACLGAVIYIDAVLCCLATCSSR